MLHQILSILALSAFCVSAAPQSLEKRGPYSSFTMFSDSNCDNGIQNDVYGVDGGYSCYPVPQSVDSIRVTGSGCYTTTWSGTNCEGSSYVLPDSNCHTVPYGSVSVQC